MSNTGYHGNQVKCIDTAPGRVDYLLEYWAIQFKYPVN